jgi:hypothetical protein
MSRSEDVWRRMRDALIKKGGDKIVGVALQAA